MISGIQEPIRSADLCHPGPFLSDAVNGVEKLSNDCTHGSANRLTGSERTRPKTLCPFLEWWLQSQSRSPIRRKFVTVFGWRRIEPPDATDVTIEWFLEDFFEKHYEELCDPENPNHIPKQVEKAARVFFRTVKKYWKPWACEIVCKEKISLKEYIRENHPDEVGKVRIEGGWE